jgi:pimeloyl-ACP methyl ester carboxylesterase
VIAAYELGATGPQVLLLHGGGGTADHWQEFAAHLDGFRPERPALDVIRELIEGERTTSLYDGPRCPGLSRSRH